MSAEVLERPSGVMECFIPGTGADLASVFICGQDNPETRAEERLQGKTMSWERQETWTDNIEAHDIRQE